MPKGVNDSNPGQGHWFDLNSSLRKPKWLGNLYLSMVLQQSEEDGTSISLYGFDTQFKFSVTVHSLPGYSVFVVKRTDPAQNAALPVTEADRLAARLPDPNSGTPSHPVLSTHTQSSHAPGAPRSRPPSPDPPSRPWQEERSHSPMHQLLEAVETDRYRDTSYPPYLRGPPRRPGPDAYEGGLGGFETIDHSDDDGDLQAAMEDRELQAALQASLMSGRGPVSANQPFFDAFQPHSDSGLESPLPLPVPPPLLHNSSSSANRTSAATNTRRSARQSRNRRSESDSGSNSGSGSRTQSGRGSSLASPAFAQLDPIPIVTGLETDPDLDPVAASVARNRLIMERMRREQEMAFEDVDMEDVTRRRRETQEEEEMLRKAIEESEKLAKEVEERERQMNQDQQPHAGESSSSSPTRVPSSLVVGHRVYDDEDEEFQAALRASLQDVPPGYKPPPSPPAVRRRPPPGLTLSRKQTLAPVMGTTDLPSVITPAMESGSGSSRPMGLGTSTFLRNATVVEDTKGEEKEKEKGKDREIQNAGTETDSEFESEMEASFIEPKEDEVSVEEMRRRRLARFGA